MRLLLASYLATQIWSWAPTPTATSYRLYWGATGFAWCSANKIEFPASVCDATSCQGDIPDPGYSIMVMVTAVNSVGEGPGEHGSIQPCP